MLLVKQKVSVIIFYICQISKSKILLIWSNIKQYKNDKQLSLICGIFKTVLENKRLKKFGS